MSGFFKFWVKAQTRWECSTYSGVEATPQFPQLSPGINGIITQSCTYFQNGNNTNMSRSHKRAYELQRAQLWQRLFSTLCTQGLHLMSDISVKHRYKCKEVRIVADSSLLLTSHLSLSYSLAIKSFDCSVHSVHLSKLDVMIDYITGSNGENSHMDLIINHEYDYLYSITA